MLMIPGQDDETRARNFSGTGEADAVKLVAERRMILVDCVASLDASAVVADAVFVGVVKHTAGIAIAFGHWCIVIAADHVVQSERHRITNVSFVGAHHDFMDGLNDSRIAVTMSILSTPGR